MSPLGTLLFTAMAVTLTNIVIVTVVYGGVELVVYLRQKRKK